MSEVLAAFGGPVVLISLAAGLSVFAVVLATSLFAGARRERFNRLRRAALRDGGRVGAAGRTGPQRDELVAAVRPLVDRFNVVKDRQVRALRHKLAQAGWRSRDALTLYMFAKLALPAGFIAVAALGLVVVAPESTSVVVQIGVVLAAGLAGSYLPEAVIQRRVESRMTNIRTALPDALDLMVICAEAGLSLDAAIARVQREMGEACPDLADELRVTSLELRFLPDRRQAFENLSRRVDLRPVRALVNTLFQTEKFGTPLAQALRVLASEQRNERMLRAEEKAARLPTIMTVPLIVFILPALFVVILGSAALDLIEVFGSM